ncbi:2-iminoacetate synthase ThiH [Pseudodesulfovibrio sp.]|uniref:2-iminoacetate synthase ThiH n=1 Tax=unclassified Pseudodesulfovibrio TaxID=2661612 RepID=UPI003B00AD0D
MSFYSTCTEWMNGGLDERIAAMTEVDVRRALVADNPGPLDLLAMLSPAATPHLEAMAQKASRLTLQHFGRTIHLFTPLYLSNFCNNHCVYCGFNSKNRIPRSQLTLEEVEVEAKAIASTGLKNLLILTGDCRAKAGPDYLRDCVTVLRSYFPSVSIEIYAMEEGEYAALAAEGVDGMTMFQETYDEKLYPTLHPRGPKSDFRFRLDAPERACRAGMRVVNIGALLGLADWRHDAFLTGLHAGWLMDRYPEVDIATSLPRMRPHAGAYQPATVVSDRDLVQVLLAMRIYRPRLGITISTREAPAFRENLLPLGVTRVSAGVSTAVGGHAEKDGEDESVGQFEISDGRSVDEMCAVLRERGFQPVFKDWEPILAGRGAA